MTKVKIIPCLDVKDGRVVTLKPGMTYQVGDGAMAHRSRTKMQTKLFIVD